ncbi:MAG: hypothetical protein ACRD4I_02730, partial [Candidatus Angelobacter sp.]
GHIADRERDRADLLDGHVRQTGSMHFNRLDAPSLNTVYLRSWVHMEQSMRRVGCGLPERKG